ncbi:MAG TPA: hypothetical protein VNO53_08105 [Steroidobacteraceae bacterium]|nr:hypothetical protein [Steroidobacteraceae bacterium]
MAKALILGLLMLAAMPACAQEPAVADDTPAADPGGDNVEGTAESIAAKPGDEAFKPPPGFKTKKRGEIVLYCMKDSTVGTRFKTEKCYDEDQMREYLLALEIQKRDIDRIRSTCSSSAVCAPQ